MSARPEAAAAPAGTAGPMHASIMRFTGDPDQLLARYDAFRAGIESSFRFHACLRGDDGIVVVDTCPSREAFEEFCDADWFRDALEVHGLPFPEIEDHPVHVALAEGRQVSP